MDQSYAGNRSQQQMALAPSGTYYGWICFCFRFWPWLGLAPVVNAGSHIANAKVYSQASGFVSFFGCFVIHTRDEMLFQVGIAG